MGFRSIFLGDPAKGFENLKVRHPRYKATKIVAESIVHIVMMYSFSDMYVSRRTSSMKCTQLKKLKGFSSRHAAF